MGKIVSCNNLSLYYINAKIIRRKLQIPIYGFIRELNMKCKLGWTIYYDAEYNLDTSKFYLSSLFNTIKIRPIIFYTNKIIAKLNISCEISPKHNNDDRELFCFEIDINTATHYIWNDFIVYSLKEIIRRCSMITNNKKNIFRRLVTESMLDLSIKYRRLLDYEKIRYSEQITQGVYRFFSEYRITYTIDELTAPTIDELVACMSDKLRYCGVNPLKYIRSEDSQFKKAKKLKNIEKNQRKDCIISNNKNRPRNFYKRANIRYYKNERIL